ncbi:uncharacterized protein LOC120694167 [Panicum virgatum]|nr:uncharacterized protein LOC120686120 [Panicum virgatum]XP_039833275.1 uncharacterized protein LOC120694167 [Panicum virgatum]
MRRTLAPGPLLHRRSRRLPPRRTSPLRPRPPVRAVPGRSAPFSPCRHSVPDGSKSPALLGALLARPPRRPDCRSMLLRGSARSVASHGSRLAFVVLRQGMDTVQCVVHAGGDDSPGVSPGMVRFAASLAAESVVDVEGVVATPRAPVLRATARHVEVRVRTIRCVARPASPGLPFSQPRRRDGGSGGGGARGPWSRKTPRGPGHPPQLQGARTANAREPGDNPCAKLRTGSTSRR